VKTFFNKVLHHSSNNPLSAAASPAISQSTAPVDTKDPSFFRLLSWPPALNRICDDLARIDRFKSALNLIVNQGVNVYVHHDCWCAFELTLVDSELRGIHKQFAGRFMCCRGHLPPSLTYVPDNERQKVAKWLYKDEPEPPPEGTPGTGTWFFEAKDFIDREKGLKHSHRVLYCPGHGTVSYLVINNPLISLFSWNRQVHVDVSSP
jgi:hypothetical protein